MQGYVCALRLSASHSAIRSQNWLQIQAHHKITESATQTHTHGHLKKCVQFEKVSPVDIPKSIYIIPFFFRCLCSLQVTELSRQLAIHWLVQLASHWVVTATCNSLTCAACKSLRCSASQVTSHWLVLCVLCVLCVMVYFPDSVT
jgi:hypothetical protein